MIEAHIRTGALVTAATVECDLKSACRMGVLEIGEDNRILSFKEKSDEPQSIPGRPGSAWANMGVYVFETQVLIDAISGKSTGDPVQDFGRDILPRLVQSRKVFAYHFRDEKENYWRDIGTLDSYYEASMDLVKVDPPFNLYDTSFPIHSSTQPRAPAKMVFADEDTGRVGFALDSLICGGSIISGGRVERSIISPDVRINSYSLVQDSILFEGVEVGRYAPRAVWRAAGLWAVSVHSRPGLPQERRNLNHCHHRQERRCLNHYHHRRCYLLRENRLGSPTRTVSNSSSNIRVQATRNRYNRGILEENNNCRTHLDSK